MPSRQDVEREVSKQVLGKMPDTHATKVRSACAEESARHYTCRVVISVGIPKSIGGGSVHTKPKTLHAVVSKDARQIVVEDLDSV